MVVFELGNPSLAGCRTRVFLWLLVWGVWWGGLCGGISAGRRRWCAGRGWRGLSACRCCAPVPWSEDRVGRILNSHDSLSPGQTISAVLKQQDACIPTRSSACGKHSESPRHPRPAHQRLTVVIYVAPDFGTRQAVGGFLAECDCGFWGRCCSEACCIEVARPSHSQTQVKT